MTLSIGKTVRSLRNQPSHKQPESSMRIVAGSLDSIQNAPAAKDMNTAGHATQVQCIFASGEFGSQVFPEVMHATMQVMRTKRYWLM